MKPVDDVESHRRKAPREGKNDKSYNFKIEVLDEGAPNKALEGSEK